MNGFRVLLCKHVNDKPRPNHTNVYTTTHKNFKLDVTRKSLTHFYKTTSMNLMYKNAIGVWSITKNCLSISFYSQSIIDLFVSKDISYVHNWDINFTIRYIMCLLQRNLSRTALTNHSTTKINVVGVSSFSSSFVSAVINGAHFLDSTK